jgi:CubicO group peptidase (beta-lactamase class C family)
MQVVERGLLDLHADVNWYLTDFQIPATYPQPVTLAHLLAHTAGFEDRWIGSKTRDPDELEPLSRALADAMPQRVEAPRVICGYSNFGADLASYLVEQVSGLSFDQFIEENVLHPLGMAVPHVQARFAGMAEGDLPVQTPQVGRLIDVYGDGPVLPSWLTTRA